MNLVLLQPRDFVGAETVRLTDERHRHIRAILKAAPGDELRVGLLEGKTGSGEITAIDDRGVELRVALTAPPPARIPLTLVLALPRPPMMRRLFRAVAELGVERLVLLNTARVEKSYWQSPVLAEDSIRAAFVDGLQQAGDTVLPELTFEKRFRPFVEDRLPGLAAGREALVAHPGTGRPCPQPLDHPALLAVGPEGGFIPYELEKFAAAGLAPVDLGERILRVETAIPVLAGKLYSVR